MRSRMSGAVSPSSLVALTIASLALSGCAGTTPWLAHHQPPTKQATPLHDDLVIRAQSPIWGPAYVADPFAAMPAPWISQPIAAQPTPSVVPTPAPATTYDPFLQGGIDPFLGGQSLGWLQPVVSPPYWNAFVAGEVKAGNRRVIGEGDLMVPLYQDGRSLLFADIRGRWDDVDNAEGNFGLAYRSMVSPFTIFGIYGFYDIKETQNGSEFQGGTIGAELLSVTCEARVNGYIPEGGTEPVSGVSQANLIGGTVFVQAGRERAYWGIDAEFGALLYEWFGGQSELRGFVGGYHFDTDADGFQHVSGPRGRLEYRSYDLPLFGFDSRLTLGVEVQWDEVRDTQVFGIARLQIPLGPMSTRPLNRLERRMLDPIVRDVDILTNTALGAREVGIDLLTGQRLDNVVVTTADDDLNTTLAAAAGPDSVVIADGREGTFESGNPVVLNADQQLLGGGSVIRVQGEATRSVTTFRAPGTRPTIHGTDPSDDVIQMVSNSHVRGVDIRGGDDGISGSNLSGFNIVNNTIAHADDEGVDLTGTTNGRIMRNTAFANNSDGFRIDDFTGGEISRNTSMANVGATSDGFEFTTGISGGTIHRNTASNNGDDGFFADAMSGGTFDHNTSTNNIDDGVDINTISGGTISFNRSTGNLDNGFESTTVSDGLITRNTASSNPGGSSDGFDFETVSGGTISYNTANGNGDDGYDFNSVSAGTITQNSARSNIDDGFRFGTFSGGTISRNEAVRNSDGFMFDGDINGMFTDNRASRNEDDGFTFNDVGATGVVTGNTASRNLGDGFDFDDVVAGGVFSNNRSNNNDLMGYDAGTNFGTAENNTGSGNNGGGDTFP